MQVPQRQPPYSAVAFRLGRATHSVRPECLALPADDGVFERRTVVPRTATLRS